MCFHGTMRSDGSGASGYISHVQEATIAFFSDAFRGVGVGRGCAYPGAKTLQDTVVTALLSHRLGSATVSPS